MGHNRLQVLFQVLPAKTYHSAVHVLNMKNSSRDSGFPGILYCISQLECKYTLSFFLASLQSIPQCSACTRHEKLFVLPCQVSYIVFSVVTYIPIRISDYIYKLFPCQLPQCSACTQQEKNCLFYSAGFPISYCISQLDIIPCTITVHATPTRTDMLAKVNYYMHGVYISIQ